MSGSRFGRRTSPVVVLAALAIVAAVAAGGCGDTKDPNRTFGLDDPSVAVPDTATPAATDVPTRPVLLPGEAPVATPGPDLGEAWTTEPDPETFIPMPDGTMVAPDQYLVMLDPAASRADADRIAASVDGTIGGHIAYVGMWKVIVWPNYHTAIISDRLATLAEQPGVLAASTVGLVSVQSGPDCAPALDDAVYAGTNSDAYDMIGVKAAWQAFYASGLSAGTVHVGFLDTELTTNSKIPWEFEDVTFIGDPPTTTQTRPATKQDPRTDGFHHADGTLGILGGSGQNGGIAGVGSPLGTRLLVSHDLLNGPATEGEPSKWTASDGVTYTDNALLKTLREIKSGATIINGSWTAADVSSANAPTARMWRKFFSQMQKDHPDVLFVYAAGNQGKALDGTNEYPAGIAAPNVISVGSVNTDGTKTDYSNLVKPGSAAEITLAAPGHQAVWGVGADGKVRATNGGTSSATPMVSATAALIRSIDPKLTAADIKKLIADTAEAGNGQVGGKTLRVDLAVRKAIDDVRARKYKLGPLTDEQIAAATAYCQIAVTGKVTERLVQPAGTSRWNILASIDASARPGRMVELTLVEDGARPADWSQAVAAGGSPAKWTILVSQKGAWIIVTRADNGYWLKYSVRDTAPEPTPTPTDEPTATPQSTDSGYDCSKPPPKGTIAYINWSLHCKPIGG